MLINYLNYRMFNNYYLMYFKLNLNIKLYFNFKYFLNYLKF